MSTHELGFDYETLTCANTYAQAQSAVDQLSNAGFPVENLRIIGLGLTSIEQVTGRLTLGRILLRTGSSGAWAGLMAGLFISILQPVFLLRALATGVLLGTLGGLVLGLVSFYARQGRRDFTSLTSTRASSYEVQVISGLRDEARRILRVPTTHSPSSPAAIPSQD